MLQLSILHCPVMKPLVESVYDSDADVEEAGAGCNAVFRSALDLIAADGSLNPYKLLLWTNSS